MLTVGAPTARRAKGVQLATMTATAAQATASSIEPMSGRLHAAPRSTLCLLIRDALVALAGR